MQRTARIIHSSTRNEVLTSAAGLLLVAAILAYQVWDFKAAFTDFDKWWVFFGPSFAGDDYIAATEDGERARDYHIYYRSLAVVTAARRVAGGRPEEIRVPVLLYPLWTTDSQSLGDFENPGLRDTALQGWSSQAVVWEHYDPVLEPAAIDLWREEGRVEELGWNVSLVHPDEDEGRFVLLTDQDRTIVYVVPFSQAGRVGVPE